MKKVYVGLALCLSVVGMAGAATALTDQEFEVVRSAAEQSLAAVPDNGYHVSAEELRKKIESGSKDFVIVDVREKEEKYKAGHIPGAIYINFEDIVKKESLAKLPKDKDIILYCNTGHEENKALSSLRMLGYKAYGLKFGYASWKKAKPSEAMLATLENADKANYPIE